MKRARAAGSLATRLVLLFALGTCVIMSGVGYALYHALGMQLDAQKLAEMHGKTQVVQHILRDINGQEALLANLPRLQDIPVGHPHLAIGVLSRGQWLIAPPDDVRALAVQATERLESLPYVEVRSAQRSWWVQRVTHRWDGPEAGRIDVVLIIDTTDTTTLLREHAAVALVVVVTGGIASAVFAWVVVRRGLAPVGAVAARAERVTAQQLEERLDVGDAPEEVRGLADSINRMLERLEQSFRDLEQFSADIAHELRTPINNLLVQTQVTLSRARPAAEYQEALHSNLVELERLQKMVSEMLFLARADRRLLELAEEDIDLAAEVSSVAEYFEAAMAEKGHRLEIAGSARVRSDRSMVRRVVTNLMSNSVRYAPRGATIKVTIEARPSGATVAVANPGADIPPAELKRLFMRFARREDSRARDREGTGLGLAIVASVMQLLGGTVDARSEDGLVIFRLLFPARAEGADRRTTFQDRNHPDRVS